MLKLSKYTGFILMLFVGVALSQETMTLQSCLEAAHENYPLIRQRGLIEAAGNYTVTNAWRGYLPQLALNGQATYQSDVTAIPIKLPAMKIDPMSKDQYKVTLDVTQVVYDGGVISSQAKLQELSAAADLEKNEADYRKVKEQVQQLYFGLLIIDEQLVQLKLTQVDVRTALKKLEAALGGGVATQTDVDVLQAEYLKTLQRETELSANRNAYNDMLCLLIGTSKTISPVLPSSLSMDNEPEINRAELRAMSLQEQMLKTQENLTTAKILPKLNIFGQGGYGKPGLNMLSNDFSSYYMFGAKFSWSLSAFYTNTNEQEILQINKKSIDVQREVFLINTKLQVKQQVRDAQKMQEMVKTDADIVALRERIKKASMAQLTNGVITANDYIRDVNQEDIARQNKILHDIQLRMAQYQIIMTTGNL